MYIVKKDDGSVNHNISGKMKKIVQTAGRNALSGFAPEFAHYNDDVLFGENWNNQDIDVKTRSIITVVALMASGVTDSSLKFHLQNAKAHGVTQKEIAAVITHVAFYAGWPKGWAVFNLAKEVWQDGEGDLPYEDEAMRAHAKEMVFPIGEPNDAFAKYFIGKSYLAPVSTSQVGIFNVTFEPAAVTIGISTTQRVAADRSLYVLQDVDIIRKRARKLLSLSRATASTFLRK